MKYDGRLYTQAEVDAMNNTPKTVESLINEAETKWASQGRTDEQKWAVRNFITGSMQEAITALNELKSELTKQQVVSALQQTALDHIVGGDYEDLLTKNLNAELRAEGLTDTDVAKYVSTTQQTDTTSNEATQLTSKDTCEHKHTYHSKETAKRAKRRRNKSAGINYLRVYRCNVCEFWHVTTERKV